MAFLTKIFYAYLFITARSNGNDPPGESFTVYPQVFESRLDKSEKTLVIEGYTLNLKKASVLADTLLLLDVTESGTVERYVQGAHYERHLYEDASKQASLILKPAGRGDYHVTGMVNFTHRIEPFTNWERSSQQKMPHRVSEIETMYGTYEYVAERTESVVDEPRPEKMENDAIEQQYIVELHFITGLNHSGFFGNESEDRVAYAMLFMNSVSLRLQQLEPPIRIGLTVIEGLQINPPYVQLYQDGNIMIDQTLNALCKHVREDKVKNISDAVYMATSRNLVKYRNNKYAGTSLGMAAGLGTACKNNNVAIGVDLPDTFSGVQTAAHELAHMLGAPHDGEGEAAECLIKSPYLMSHYRRGKTICAFSSCTKEIIANFLRKTDSACLREHKLCHVISLPNKAANLPGDVMDAPTYCNKTYPKPQYLSATYIKA
ncbi:venom metalloproteinase antarease-like TtrivMP_A [Dermacentor silvarum]|uniref:venom metalloproteinase antarease-like TtrivMP_A n=1 Tax=Dermacentor silvarum TaxID=543639 RepID=UPI002100D783|nr:venom metalloproteinase antarease-like TtrivMP_A [Dermacentor silvarum]